MNNIYDENVEHDKCMLPGALAIVFHISRVLGIAPLNLDYNAGRYIGSVSRCVAIYGYVLTFIGHIIFLSSRYLVPLLRQFESEPTVFPLGTIVLNMIGLSITGMASYCAGRRMKRMFSYIITLQKISYKLEGIDTYHNQKVTVMMLVYLISLGVFIVFVNVFTFNSNKVSLEFFLIMFYIEYYKIILLHIEYALVQLEIYQVLKMMNKNLRQLIDGMKSDSMTAYTIRSNCDTVRDLMKSYLSICVLVESLNKDNGCLMFLLFSNSIFVLIITACNLIDAAYLSSLSNQTFGIFHQLAWCMWHLSTAVLFVEPCHRINEEVIEIKFLLINLMYDMTAVGKPIALELDLMFKQLLLNEPQMSPLRMYTVQRSLLIKAIAFITTYLAIIIQQIKNQRWQN